MKAEITIYPSKYGFVARISFIDKNELLAKDLFTVETDYKCKIEEIEIPVILEIMRKSLIRSICYEGTLAVLPEENTNHGKDERSFDIEF